MSRRLQTTPPTAVSSRLLAVSSIQCHSPEASQTRSVIVSVPPSATTRANMATVAATSSSWTKSAAGE